LPPAMAISALAKAAPPRVTLVPEMVPKIETGG
jgi:hypothetical protein